MVLRGPGEFAASRRISYPRVLAGSQGSRLDLGNLSIGTINIPSQLFTQFILKVLPTGYREFTGQVTENQGELEISVASRNPPQAWRVSGPSDAFPEMMEYLALRMALDLNPELIKSSGLDRSPYDQELAFAMGNEAFRQGRYRRARAFFEVADRFAPSDEKIDAMLALAYYHERDGQVDATILKAMEAAIQEDQNGDSSLLRPYLACLYHKAGLEDQAQAERFIFNRYLLRLEFQQFDARVDALKQLPLRGPGRHLSVMGDDVIFVNDKGAIAKAAAQPIPEGQSQVSVIELSPANQNPRQIKIYDDANLLSISPDGAVYAYRSQATEADQTPIPLVEGRALRGVQQIETSPSQFGRTNLFLLNRSGQVYWCEPDVDAGNCSPRQLRFDGVGNVTQIFPVEDQLYMVTSDGVVWYTEINISGQVTFTPRRLIQPTEAAKAQEIFVADDGTLYLLYDNGRVWRYYDDGRPETEDLKLVDPSTDTAQIFATGGYLYLLKSDGAVWRISNPRNPDPASDFTKIEFVVLEKVPTIQEMFVVAGPPAGDGLPGDRILYLLTNQRALLQGTDTGDPRMVLVPMYTPTPPQAAVVQQL